MLDWTCWFERQNWIKNSRVMLFKSLGQSGVLAYFGLKIDYFGHIFWDMDLKYVLPSSSCGYISRLSPQIHSSESCKYKHWNKRLKVGHVTRCKFEYYYEKKFLNILYLLVADSFSAFESLTPRFPLALFPWVTLTPRPGVTSKIFTFSYFVLGFVAGICDLD